MPALGRKFYLVGFLDGTTATYSDAKRAIQSELDRIPGCKAKTCYDRMFAFERQEEGSLDDSEHGYDAIDVEQLEAGIDKIYSDFRNLNIPVFEAEQVAMQDPSAARATQKCSGALRSIASTSPVVLGRAQNRLRDVRIPDWPAKLRATSGQGAR